jgi:myo-inositol-1-phosphate synthase
MAYAALQEDCPYINGSPQNTFTPALQELAKQKQLFLAGDDLKTGQTRLKGCLLEYFTGAGMKLASVASYNHLGNMDGYNLSNAEMCESKIITKSSLTGELTRTHPKMYPEHKSLPDHKVCIEYMPYVGDSKRAMDEYIGEILMGGHYNMNCYTICEDSLLAVPVMMDLILCTDIV